MATVRCWALHGQISNAIFYILDVKGDGEKTENMYYECTSGNAYSACYDWQINNDLKKETNSIVGFHFQQSFEPGSISKEEAFEISKEWIEEITEGQYDYVIALHTDTKSIHSHIIINPFNKKTNKKWTIYYKRDLPKFKMISDRICKEHGLSILRNGYQQGKSYYEWMVKNKGDSLKDVIAKTLDNLVDRVSSYEELKGYLIALGYEIEDGLENQQNSEEFTFTGDIKLVKDKNEDLFVIRLPYTKEYIHVDSQSIEWLKKDKTFRITYSDKDFFKIYDEHGNEIRTVPISDLNLYWERKEKSSGRREGLRIKIPGSNKFIRCKRIEKNENGEGYSLQDIFDRIENNGRLVCDPSVKQFLSLSNEKEIIAQEKEKFFNEAHIKIKWTNTSYYRMSKKERYISYKTSQIQSRLNTIYVERESIDVYFHLDKFKKHRSMLRKELKTINNELKRQEELLSQIQEQKMENILDITQQEMDEFVQENIVPLYKTKKNLSEELKKIDKMIKQGEKYKEKEKNQKERVIE